MKKSIKAYAKVNLILDIVSKRPDGYHDLRSVMQTIPLADDMEIEVLPGSSGNVLSISAVCTNADSFPDIKWDESNLVCRAAKLFVEEACVPIEKAAHINIKLTKNIPSGAGLGGGSADAAAVLNALNEMLEAGMPAEKLCRLGAKLGADVPFCIMGGTVLCEGIGEKLTPLSAAPKVTYLINKPEVSLSTKLMYQKVDEYIDTDPHPDTDKLVDAIMHGDKEFYKYISNFMEKAAVSICPEIEEIKKDFIKKGAVASFMTGSGSAVVGIFLTE